MLAGTQVQVGPAPGVHGHFLQVAAGLEIARFGIEAAGFHQRLQALLSGGVDVVVEAIDLERGFDGLEIRLHFLHPGLIGTVEYRGGHHGDQQPHDHQHYQNFHQGKPALAGLEFD